MKHRRKALFFAVLLPYIACSAAAQAPANPVGQGAAPGLRKLTGDDAKRAEELQAQINQALEAGRWDEAIAKAEEGLALVTKVKGSKHFDTVSVEWQLKALRRVAPMPEDERAAFLSAKTMDAQARVFSDQGKYAAAQPLYKKALEIRGRLLTDDHPDTAVSCNNLAHSLWSQGKSAEAQPLFEKALAICRRLLTDDHPQTALSFDNLAANLSQQGKYAAARPLCEKALAIRLQLLGDDHPDTAQSYNNVAYNLQAQGRYAAAQPLLEKSLAIRRRLHTDNHPSTARSYNNLAANLNAQGKYAAAQPLYEKALAIKRRLLTVDHPDTALSYNNLAGNLNAQGKYAAAQPLFEQALGIRRQLLGEDHRDTADSYNNVAMNLQSQGKSAEAQPLFEKALAIKRRLLTDDHPSTALSYHSLASNLNAQGKYSAAQPLLEKALAIDTRLLTDDHPSTARSYHSLASNLNAQGKYSAAQPLFEKALAIRRRLFTDDHLDTAESYDGVARNLNAQGKYTAAQPLFEKALAIQRRLLTDDHPSTAMSYNNLANNLDAQGKYSAAQLLIEKALAIQRRLLTDDHPSTAMSLNNLAVNLEVQGKYAAAQPLYEKALEINRRLLTDDHPQTARSYNRLQVNLDAQGKHAEAQPLGEKALEIRRRLLTDDHPDTALSYNNLAANLKDQGKYADAQPLFEKALEIHRRLQTDDHPYTAVLYRNLASNLDAQGKYAAAQPLFEKALAINRKLFTDDNPDTALSYNGVASNLNAQGKYAAAQPLHEKALAISRRMLGDDHPSTATSYKNRASNLNAQGKYNEAKDGWQGAVMSLDAARLQTAFAGLERAGRALSPRPNLAAVQARLGQPAEAWQALEEDLGRGLLDELAARQDKRLTAIERDRIRELTTELERLDRLAESTPKDLAQAERAKQFEELKHKREQASIALGEFQTKLLGEYGALAGQVASQKEIQAALPADTALVAWVDIPPLGPNAADQDGEHWGVVVRSRGIPVWVPTTGTGANGLWSDGDTALASQVKSELRSRQGAGSANVQRLIGRLRAQRLDPLAKALSATADGLPSARRLIVLPSRAMASIPIEALVARDESARRPTSAASAGIPARSASEGKTSPEPSLALRTNMERSGESATLERAGEGAATEPSAWTVSYAPSGTVFKYLREQPRPDRDSGLLALGDPVFQEHGKSSDPARVPDHGLLVNVVVRGSNAASHGLKQGDVLLAYNGQALTKKDDLKVISEGDKPVTVEIWSNGRSSRRELAPGKLGVVLDPRPAPVAIVEARKLQQVLTVARSGDNHFASLPGTRQEVETLARLFASADRPVKALLGTNACEPEIDRIATSGELARFGFIHLATHGVIDEAIPQRSAVILTQTGLPDPLEQVMNHKPVFDGRLSVREIQRTWDLKAELVTLSACETALGRESGGEGFVGFTQALLMSGARSVCLSLWKVDDKATSLLMTRFYQNLLGKRSDLSKAMPKAEALEEAKRWLRNLTVEQIEGELAGLERGKVRPLAREKGAPARQEAPALKASSIKPYEHPHFWAAFVLVGDPD
jgi:tetratricopeptide (TPR) repeat protein